jgi:hypothetical protein
MSGPSNARFIAFRVFLSNWSSKAPQKRCATRPCLKDFSKKIMKGIDEKPQTGFFGYFSLRFRRGALKKRKSERPRTCAEPIQKAPAHLLFFFFFDLDLERRS